MIADITVREFQQSVKELQRECERLREENSWLRKNHDRLIDFMATASDSWFETDADLRLIAGKRPVGGARGATGFADLAPATVSAFAGKTIFEIVGDDPEMRSVMEEHRADVDARRPFREFVCRFRVGEKWIWLETNGNPYFDERGQYLGYRGIARNITARKEDEALIEFMVRHDHLTKLANRMLLREKIDEALQYRASDRPIAILCLDLDRFKTVNDTFGHATGDSLLKTVAERLLAAVAARDTVARTGGDEFVVVLRDLEGPTQASEAAAHIIETIARPVNIDGDGVTVGTGIGIAVAPVDGNDAETLLQRADIALYKAKTEGSGVWRFFSACDPSGLSRCPSHVGECSDEPEVLSGTTSKVSPQTLR